MPTRYTEVHISSPVPSMSLRAKDHLEGTKVAVSPRYCAEQKVQTGSAAAGGHRRVATREATGDLTTRRGAGDPVRRAEWMTVYRYGHFRSAPVVVDAGYARSGNRLHSLQPCVNSTRQPRRLHDGLFPLQRLTVTRQVQKVARGAERRRSFFEAREQSSCRNVQKFKVALACSQSDC